MPSAKSKKVNDSQASSQSMTQTQKAVASMTAEELERKINETVKYLLIADQKKVPIKKLDIAKNVLKEHSKAFPKIIEAASKRLESVFGMELKELEDNKHNSYILVNKIDIDVENNHLKWPEEDNQKMGLIMIVLSLIFMSGNVIQESQLWNALKKFGIDPDLPHEVFGDVKKLLTQEMVRQCYLEVVRQPNTDPPESEFKWGQRAKLETSKRNVLNFVSQIYEIESSQWISQWQDVVLSEGGDLEQPGGSGDGVEVVHEQRKQGERQKQK